MRVDGSLGKILQPSMSPFFIHTYGLGIAQVFFCVRSTVHQDNLGYNVQFLKNNYLWMEAFSPLENAPKNYFEMKILLIGDSKGNQDCSLKNARHPYHIVTSLDFSSSSIVIGRGIWSKCPPQVLLASTSGTFVRALACTLNKKSCSTMIGQAY